MILDFDIRVISSSGTGQPAARSHAWKDGANDYMSKGLASSLAPSARTCYTCIDTRGRSFIPCWFGPARGGKNGN